MLMERSSEHRQGTWHQGYIVVVEHALPVPVQTHASISCRQCFTTSHADSSKPNPAISASVTGIKIPLLGGGLAYLCFAACGASQRKVGDCSNYGGQWLVRIEAEKT